MVQQEQMTRQKGTLVAIGAGVGGALLVALSIFLLTTLDDEAQNAVGVFITLAVGLVVLGLSAVIFSGLRHGKSAQGRQMLTVCWVGLALVGLVLTVVGVLNAELPWIAFAIVPLLVVVGLVKDIGRVRRIGEQ
jgi:FtsH-binding integral membrane protein